MARFELESISRDPQTFARLLPADLIFTFLSRRARMPVDCIGLAWSGEQSSLVHPGIDIDGDGVSRVLLVRAEPIHLDYHFAGLPSADGHDISALLRIAVQVVHERSELMSFCRRVLGSSERVTVSGLARHCEETVRFSAAAFCKARPAGELVQVETWAAFDAELAEAFRSFGFQSGLALGRDVRAEFRSPAFAEIVRQRRADEVRRQRLESETALKQAAHQAREQHLASLAALNEKVRALAAGGGSASLGELIRTFDPARRGELYGSLLQTAPEHAVRSILIVAGDELIAIDPRSHEIAARHTIDGAFGPLRSIRSAMDGDDTRILIGARNGVHVLDGELRSITSFGFEAPRSLRGGVNAAVIRGDELLATHSEVGLLTWKLHDSKAHAMAMTTQTSGARAVRDVQVDSGNTVWFTADSRVIGAPAGAESEPIVLEADAEVTSLIACEDGVFAGLLNGSILRWPCKAPFDRELIRGKTADAVESLDWFGGGGVPRLVIADKRPLIELRVLGDAYSAAYHADQNVRWAWMAGNRLLGVNDRRDQLLMWEPGELSRPSGGIHVGKLCGHQVQDVVIV